MITVMTIIITITMIMIASVVRTTMVMLCFTAHHLQQPP